MPSTDISTLSLHDALPIWRAPARVGGLPRRADGLRRRASVQDVRPFRGTGAAARDRSPRNLPADLARLPRAQGPLPTQELQDRDRKSTRLNSSHVEISYAVHRHLHSFPTRRSSDLASSSSGRWSSATCRWPSPTCLRSRCSAFPRNRRCCSGPISSKPSGGSRSTSARARSASNSGAARPRSEEHTSELQSRRDLVCRPPTSPLFPYTTLFRSGELQLGSVVFRDVPMAFADVPPFKMFGLSEEPALLLGTDLLETFRRISLDFRARKVRFQLRSCKTEIGRAHV